MTSDPQELDLLHGDATLRAVAPSAKVFEHTAPPIEGNWSEPCKFCSSEDFAKRFPQFSVYENPTEDQEHARVSALLSAGA